MATMAEFKAIAPISLRMTDAQIGLLLFSDMGTGDDWREYLARTTFLSARHPAGRTVRVNLHADAAEAAHLFALQALADRALKGRWQRIARALNAALTAQWLHPWFVGLAARSAHPRTGWAAGAFLYPFHPTHVESRPVILRPIRAGATYPLSDSFTFTLEEVD